MAWRAFFFLLSFLPINIVMCSSPALQQKFVKANLGDEVTLQCNFTGHSQITAVMWDRTDNSGLYVLLYRDNILDPVKQDPSYKGRVDLLDPTMTDGEVSFTLKNVTGTDNGTYECFVAEKSKRQKRGVVPGPPVCRVTVVVPHQTHGDEQQSTGPVHVGVYVIIAVLLFLLVLCPIIISRNKNRCGQQETGRAESQVV